MKARLFMLNPVNCTYLSFFDANELLWFEWQVSELEQVWVESKIGQFEDFLEPEWKISVSGLNHLVCGLNKVISISRER